MAPARKKIDGEEGRSHEEAEEREALDGREEGRRDEEAEDRHA